MLISEIRSSHEIHPQFDEAIASPAGKFLSELTEIFIVLKTDGLCPCLTGEIIFLANNCSPLQLLPMALDGFLSRSDRSNASQALEQKSSSVQHLSVDGQ